MRILADDGTLDWHFVRAFSTVLLNVTVAVFVALWSWIWLTFPVNDNVAPQWTESDWMSAALGNFAWTIARAIVMIAALTWINRRLLKPIASKPWPALAVAAGAGLIVLSVGAAGALVFLGDRPVF